MGQKRAAATAMANAYLNIKISPYVEFDCIAALSSGAFFCHRNVSWRHGSVAVVMTPPAMVAAPPSVMVAMTAAPVVDLDDRLVCVHG
jgi:hypothetical protein